MNIILILCDDLGGSRVLMSVFEVNGIIEVRK